MSTESLGSQPLYRGEVWFTQNDIESINEKLKGSNYRFEFISEVYLPPKVTVTKVKPQEFHLRSKSQSMGDEYVPYKPSKKRTYSGYDLYSRYDSYGHSSSEQWEKRSSRPRKQPLTFLEEFYEEHAHTTYPESQVKIDRNKTKIANKASKKETKQVKIMYRTVPISTKHLPKLSKNTWEYCCYRILQMIKYMDTDKWFWYPVDPVVDGVPNYLTIIKRPMDFHTITERLHTNHYTSPYGWQIDMRQIFYNAFLFYPKDNVIWKSAQNLSLALENKLKSSKYVNPYDFFESLSMDPAKVKEEIEKLYAPRTRKAYDTWMTTTPTTEETRRRRLGKSIRMDDDNYLDLDSMDSSGDYTDDDEYVNLNSKYAIKKASRTDRGLRQERAADMARRRKQQNFVTKTYVQEEIPQYGFVPQPPTLQKMLNDKPLTISQQKTLQTNMYKLAPNQRKAALELIQDELGILAENHKDDPDFFFDTDLLSIERQKQFFTYVNQMAKTNMEHILKTDKTKAPKQPVDLRVLNMQETMRTTSGMFSESSSTSSISDVASNLLSSDDFFSSSDPENDIVPEKPVPTDTQKDTGLPEYLPVDEFENAKTHLSEVIMGNHADFLGKIDTPVEQDVSLDRNKKILQTVSNQGKKSAWMDWKGQAIHHRDVAQQTGVPPRNEDEQIAESFDARI